MVPVKHRKCGGVTGWYLLDKPRVPDRALSKDYMRLDGTQPKKGESFSEVCACCGERIEGTPDLDRCFDEPTAAVIRVHRSA